VTFFRKKPGHLLYPGRALCGISVVPISACGRRSFATIRQESFRERAGFGPCAAASGCGWHKYARGHAAVFSGGRHATGAARFSAMAAQRAGAGAVTILGQPDALDIHAAHVTSIMLRACGRTTPMTACAT
jgi:NAD(P)H-hydrate repair Nnr-like enzyme with NAD(P)H-hydrate dehydratase domain